LVNKIWLLLVPVGYRLDTAVDGESDLQNVFLARSCQQLVSALENKKHQSLNTVLSPVF
jgi:hypothetical protein